MATQWLSRLRFLHWVSFLCRGRRGGSVGVVTGVAGAEVGTFGAEDYG